MPQFSLRIAELERKALDLEKLRKEREKLLNINSYFKDQEVEVNKDESMRMGNLGLANRLRQSIIDQFDHQ